MPAPATTRTVAEVMSTPAVTAHSSETIAEVSARMEERKKGSAIVVDGDRPIGILTERDLVRFNATGAAAGRHEGQRVDDAAGRLRGARPLRAGGLRTRSPSTATATCRSSRTASSSASCRCASLMEFAQIQPVVHPSTIEAPPGLEGVIVAETSVGDVRGLEGFYHYRQYNAVELADKLSPRGRVVPAVRRPPPDRGRAGGVRGRDRAAARRARRRSPTLLPALAASSQTVMEAVRSAMSMVGAAEGYKPTLDIDHAERRRNALQMCAVMPTLIMAIHRLQQGLAAHRAPRWTSATAPTTSGCSPARSSTRTRAGPSSSTRSPRSTTASTPPPSPPG